MYKINGSKRGRRFIVNQGFDDQGGILVSKMEGMLTQHSLSDTLKVLLLRYSHVHNRCYFFHQIQLSTFKDAPERKEGNQYVSPVVKEEPDYSSEQGPSDQNQEAKIAPLVEHEDYDFELGNLCFEINLQYHTIPHHTILYHTIPHHTIPCHTTPYHTISYHTIPYHTIPY